MKRFVFLVTMLLWAFIVGRRVLKALIAKGGDASDIKHILTDDELSMQLAEKVIESRDIFKITVGGFQSILQLVEVGNYDWSESRVNDGNFSVTITNGVTEVDATLVHLNRAATEEDVVGQMKLRGLRPGIVDELLSFASAHPRVQESFSILALGSKCQGTGEVAAIGKGVSRRWLRLFYYSSEMAINSRFLAFRE